MSESAATPETGPAGGLLTADQIVDRLMAEEADGDAADTDAEAEPRQPTSGAQSDNPDAGDDQSDDKEPVQADEEPAEPTVTVKVRGEDRQIPLSEALKGYSRTEDYKAKTAEVARERETLAAQKAELTARAAQIDRLLAQAPFDPVLDEGSKTDWVKLSQEDPAGYVQKRAAFEAKVADLNVAAQERQRLGQDAHREALARSDEALSEALPEWRDKSKRAEVTAKVAKTLMDAGFSKDDLNGITDHRVVQIAYAAALHNEAKAARASAEAKRVAPTPPKVMRPGTSGGPKGAGADTRALLKTAQFASRTDDRVEAVLRLLDT